MRKKELKAAEVLPFLAMQLRANSLPPNIVVSGQTCSGKTTFVEGLRLMLGSEGRTSTTLPLDNYFRDVDDLALPKDAQGEPLFDVPGSYHKEEFLAGARALSRGRTTKLPRYDLPTNKRIAGESTVLKPAEFLIYEGLFASLFLEDLGESLHIFVHTPTKVCMERRITRDRLVWKVTAERAEENFRRKILPYWDFCLVQLQNAHVIVNNS